MGLENLYQDPTRTFQFGSSWYMEPRAQMNKLLTKEHLRWDLPPENSMETELYDTITAAWKLAKVINITTRIMEKGIPYDLS